MEHFHEAPRREEESKTQGDTPERLQMKRITSKRWRKRSKTWKRWWGNAGETESRQRFSLPKQFSKAETTASERTNAHWIHFIHIGHVIVAWSTRGIYFLVYTQTHGRKIFSDKTELSPQTWPLTCWYDNRPLYICKMHPGSCWLSLLHKIPKLRQMWVISLTLQIQSRQDSVVGAHFPLWAAPGVREVMYSHMLASRPWTLVECWQKQPSRWG